MDPQTEPNTDYGRAWSSGKEDSGNGYLHPHSEEIPTQQEQRGNMVLDLKGGGRSSMRGKRFDSGVADLDQVSPQIAMHPMGSGFRPQSKNYDYADYPHQYEELPNRTLPRIEPSEHKFVTGSGSESEQPSASGTTVTEAPSDCDDTAAIVTEGDGRKRYNPLYDNMAQSSPSIYTKAKKCSRDQTVFRQLRCLKTLVVVLIFVCMAATALSVYTVITSNINRTTEGLSMKLTRMENQYQDLYTKVLNLQKLLFPNSSENIDSLLELSHKVSLLESNASTEIASVRHWLTNTTHRIQVNQDQIFAIYSNISDQIGALNGSVQQQLLDISKMPGPQGPQGVGNLSACYYKDFTSSSAAGHTSITTSWRPDYNNVNGSVVMSAFCTASGGAQYQTMEVEEHENNRHKYRCICTGNSGGQRYCILYLWLCPRES